MGSTLLSDQPAGVRGGAPAPDCFGWMDRGTSSTPCRQGTLIVQEGSVVPTRNGKIFDDPADPSGRRAAPFRLPSAVSRLPRPSLALTKGCAGSLCAGVVVESDGPDRAK